MRSGPSSASETTQTSGATRSWSSGTPREGYIAEVPTLGVRAQGRDPVELEARLREAVQRSRAENSAEVEAVLDLWSAPFDDEPVTEEEARLVAVAEEDVRAGRVIAHDEVNRRLGIA